MVNLASILLSVTMLTTHGGAELNNATTQISKMPPPIEEQIVEQPMPKAPNFDELVKPSIVWATVTKQGTLYVDMNCTKPIGTIAKGSKVEIIRDHDKKWYKINYQDQIGWVTKSYLSIPKDPPTNQNRLSEKLLEQFVNENDFTCPTKYFIWVDLDRQLTYIFLGEKNKWKLHKTITVATGKNASPTIRGTFEIQGRGKGFAAENGIHVDWYTQFYGPYRFHSVLLNDAEQIVDNTLGKRVSHGCIRMSLADAKWMYDYVPNKSTVWIN